MMDQSMPTIVPSSDIELQLGVDDSVRCLESCTHAQSLVSIETILGLSLTQELLQSPLAAGALSQCFQASWSIDSL